MVGAPLPPAQIQLSQVAFAGRSVRGVLEQLATIAVAAIDGCDGAGLTLGYEGGDAVTASSDPVAAALDSTQGDMGEGPCVVCQQTGRTEELDAAEAGPPWPRLAEVARRHGILSCLGVPLVFDGEVLGALNLYSRARRAGSPELQEAGTSLAHRVSSVVANAQRYATAQLEVSRLCQLMRGSEDELAQATGILMARHGWTADSALAHIREDARRQGRSDEDAARLVVASVP